MLFTIHSRIRPLRRIACFVVLIFAGNQPWANDEVKEVETKPPVQKGDLGVDRLHTNISTQTQDFAKWLDSFFGGNYGEEEGVTTRLTLNQGAFWRESNGMSYPHDVSFKLYLPRWSKALNLVFEDNREEGESVIDVEEDSGSRRESLFGLEYLLVKNLKSSFRFDSGVRVGEQAVYFGTRYRFTTSVGANGLRLSQKNRWFNTDGWQSQIELQLYHRINEENFFKQRFAAYWEEEAFERELAGAQLESRITRILSPKRAVRLAWISDYESKPLGNWRQSLFRLTLRQNKWRDWFFIELAPQLAFSVESDWKGKPGIHLNFVAVFGGGPRYDLK